MATEWKDGKIVNIKREDVSLCENDLTLLTLLQEANRCPDYQKKSSLLAKCVSYTASCERSSIKHLMSQEQFKMALLCALDSTIVPAFDDKEYFSYEKEEFQKYPEITNCVLSIFNNILSRFVVDCDFITKNGDQSVELEETITNQSISISIAIFLPKLLIVIGAHMNNPLWSSEKLEDLSLQVLHRLLLGFSSKSSEELLLSMQTFSVSNNFTLDASERTLTTGNKVTLFYTVLSYCLEQLSKNLWHRNPFLCQSFYWLTLQMKLPNLSDYVEQIMSISLNFLEDHQPVNKIRGISCLHHLIKNTSAEEMRWLNRADVIYEKLKNQVYLKEATVVECLFPCLFDILRVLESPPDLNRHHFVLATLLRDTEGENLLVLRKIYVRSLTFLLEQIGIYSVSHLKHFIKIIGNYLEVDDGFGESSARPDTLKLLEGIIKVAWPRIQQYADAVLKTCLNLIADIHCAILQDTNISDVKSDLIAQAIQCLVLLSEVCPDVLLCLKAALRSGVECSEKNSQLFDVLKRQLASVDT